MHGWPMDANGGFPLSNVAAWCQLASAFVISTQVFSFNANILAMARLNMRAAV